MTGPRYLGLRLVIKSHTALSDAGFLVFGADGGVDVAVDVEAAAGVDDVVAAVEAGAGVVVVAAVVAAALFVLGSVEDMETPLSNWER